ncbi:basic 7S globulin 2-like [Papaver somniferum]|uniref:basic 7S globulin 2-like n=1 Tax=Papaver somniferum TaxID=3469 RepID=UPI000E6FECC2|nr:basic 7S globulin 2-like [Papaver somniferum]
MASFSLTHQSSNSYSSSVFFSAIFFLVFIVSFSNAQPASSSRPQGVVLPVTKDSSTLQYLTYIKQGTPLVAESLVVNLAGEILWVDCQEGYVSSSNRSLNCLGSECLKLQKISKSCGPYSDPIMWTLCPDVTVRNFSFGCGSTSLLKGLAERVKGMAGFGPFAVSVPLQLSLSFRIPRVFAMCLPSSTSSKGVIFIGGGPYIMQPGNDLSTSLTYTPFYTNPIAFSTSEYYIQVNSIKIREAKIPMYSNSTEYRFRILTTINTLIPYTVMRTSIYNQFTSIFSEQAKAMNIPRVAPVAPFGTCFDSRNISGSCMGAVVPVISLVLHKENIVWKIFGPNSMVRVSDEVSCLGFVHRGNDANMLVIGGYQLEDNLLEFNLAKMRLGFTTTLGRRRQTSCSNFDFQ